MSKVAWMRQSAFLFRKVAPSQGHAWTPVRRAPLGLLGAGFTSRVISVQHRFALLTLLLSVAGAAAATGRTPGSFSVSSTGEAQYSIPIFAPPGVNGLAPEVALTYGHRHRGTLAGIGWSVSGLSAIHRCEKTWAQNGVASAPQNELDDRYCIDGNQLRLFSGSYGAAGSTYRTEIETYSRITASGSAGNGPASFKVELKSGLIHEYGTNTNSRILSIGQPEARAWALNRVSDRAGNSITFTWHNDTANGSYRIDRIDYATNSIDFVWESKPAGEISSGFVTGSQVREIHRLQAIEVMQGGSVLRRYALSYEGPLSSTSRSRLASIEECAGSQCRDATTFDYQNGTAGLQAEMNTGQPVPAGAMPLDVNGDGREDLVYVSSATSGSGTWRVMLANASGGYNAPTESGQSNQNFTGAIPIDYDHDGLGDVLVPYSGTHWYVMLGSTSGLGALTPTGTPATTTGRGANARALDIDGDGRDDLVWADLTGGFAGGDAIRYRLRNPSGTGFSSTVSTLVAAQPADSRILTEVFSDWAQKQPGRTPDFNGDGRGDLVYRHEKRTWQEPLGSYAMTRTMRALCAGGGCSFAQNLPGGAGPPGFGDFNGDGLTDLFYYSGPTQLPNNAMWWYAFSRGTSFLPVTHSNLNPFTLQWVVLDWDADGYDDVLAEYTSGGWQLTRATGVGFANWTSVGISLPGFPPTAVTDIDGDGLHDFAYAQSGTWRYRQHLGTTPDLLSRVTDGYGNTIDVNYAPLTAAGVHGKTLHASFPEQEWQGPMTVVTEHRASDGIGGTYSIDHTYAGARQHAQGRGFEGFSLHTQVDDRNGVKTHRQYMQLFPHTGSLERTEVRQSNGPIESNVFSWSTLAPPGGIESRVLPVPVHIMRSTYGVDVTSKPPLLTSGVTHFTIDAMTGTPIEIRRTTTEASGANGIHGGRTWIERTVFSQLFSSTTSANWCVGRPQRVQQINSHSTLPDGAEQTRTLALTWDPTFCRPTQKVVEPDIPQWRVQTDLDYDGFGNVETQAVSNSQLPAHVWQTTWSADGRFPIGLRNPLNQTTQRTFDPRFGAPASDTDPNSLSTSWLYDGFGRRTRETRPDQTRTDWAYAECGNNCGQNRLTVTATLRDTAGAPIRSDSAHLDAYDRPLVIRAQILGGGYSRFERQYDDLGRLARESAPCTESACPSPLYWTTYAYDLIGRPTQISRPFTSSSTQTTAITYVGLTTTLTDPLGNISIRTADGRGQIARSTDDDGYHQSFDFDAFGNPVRVTDSAGRTLQTAAFNVRGLLDSATDADLGTRQYDYDAFGQMASHTDANGKTTTYTWDVLGRPLTQAMPEGSGTITRRWTWGTSAAAREIDRLKESQISGTGVITYREAHAYDAKGRPLRTEFFQGASSLGSVDLGYASTTGLVDSLTYPESTAGYRLKLKYDYEQGLLRRVRDFNAPSTVFWQATTMDAYGQILDETLGNGLKTIRGIEPRTGSLNTITSGPTSDLTARQDLEYVWDRAGNLTSRQDLNRSLTEAFEYDELHRLTRVRLNSVETLALAYDFNGNILSQSGVGSYSYHPSKLHAVTSISVPAGGTQSFLYDANGNMTSRNGTELLWFADNRPKRIRKIPGSVSNSSEFQYGADGQRWYHKLNVSGTTYTNVNLGGIFEIVTRGAIDDFRHTIHANGVPIALYSRKSTGTNTLRYLLRDHLGSIDAITTSTGAPELQTSFAPFGERRGPNWSGDLPSEDITTLREISRRGFTDHEHLGNNGLIHMNGRVYDPVIARFVSADPFVDGVMNTQGWNRYSYVGNNPLSYTDPSGYVGVPRSPDDSPEGTPGNQFSCTGWGFSGYCDPLQHFDNARGRDPDSTVLTFAQVLALVERIWLQKAGTENLSPHLGQAAGEGDFASTLEALNVADWWNAESTVTFCGPTCARGWDGDPSGLFAPHENTARNGERVQDSILALTSILPVGVAVTRGAQVAVTGGRLVIGRGADLAKRSALKVGEYKLGWPTKLPNWKAEWAENAGRLRAAMRQGSPIRDMSPGDRGGIFLNAERALLRDRGWTFDPRTNFWIPPGT